jgi:hypothetical protein
MRTTIDIPEPIYRALKTRAARERSSIKALILQMVARDSLSAASHVEENRIEYPLTPSKRPGSMKLGEEGVYEYILFP